MTRNGRSHWFQRLACRTPTDHAADIHAPAAFAAILRRERAGVDRNGHPMALVLFDVVSASSDVAQLLIDAIKKRIRTTDEVGWFDRGRVGILLPFTADHGARRVATDVCRQVANRHAPPPFQVYCYPDDWTADDQGDPGQDGVAGRPDQPGASRLPAPHAVAREGLTGAMHTARLQHIPARSLEPLLARRLPAWKRAMDIIGAILGLASCAPLMLAVAAAIKLSSPGPVLFGQKRSGRGGVPFTIYKFRTMVREAESLKIHLLSRNDLAGPAFKLARDPRTTSLGRWLRRTSMDELPQLWNVLKGDMSLVGPRPLPCEETDLCDRWHRRRLEVTPGLTGIWQVSGRCAVGFEQWMRMDLQYARTHTFRHDLKILLATIPAVVSGRGAR